MTLIFDARAAALLCCFLPRFGCHRENTRLRQPLWQSDRAAWHRLQL